MANLNAIAAMLVGLNQDDRQQLAQLVTQMPSVANMYGPVPETSNALSSSVVIASGPELCPHCGQSMPGKQATDRWMDALWKRR
jgi:hypothetical protein